MTESKQDNPLLEKLDGRSLAKALRAASHYVIKRRHQLNEINVFPVPDSDTGSNLAATMLSLAKRFENMEEDENAGQVAVAAAEAALDGAKGNSGAIFAQFLYGFAQTLREAIHLDTHQFAMAAVSGTNAAYNAILEPREGTILSVLKAWSDEIRTHAPSVKDFRALIERGLNRANEALKKTAEQLEVLARHNVVDAGGQGFLYFAHGMLAFLKGENIEQIDFDEVLEDSASEQIHFDADEQPDSKFRFCTEALVNQVALNASEIRSAISDLGDSTVIAGDSHLMKVHIHTDAPGEFFRLVDNFGHIKKSKIDDLRLQSAPRQQSRVAIVIDSTCDLPEEDYANLPVYMVPLSVTFGEESFNDRLGMSTPHFYTKQRESEHHPHTSQPAVGAFVRTYKRLLEEYENIVTVSLSKATSGTFQSAMTAAKMLESDRIHIINSRQISGGIGVLTRMLAREITKPFTSIEKVIEKVKAARDRTRIFAGAANLKSAAKGGRINKHAAAVLDFLRIRPVLGVNLEGKISKLGLALGYKGCMKSVADKVIRHVKETKAEDVIITHAHAHEDAMKMAKTLEEKLRIKSIPVVETGAVLGTHVGPGTVCVGVLSAEKKN